MGGINSGYGYPIADPQFLADGTICSVFVGGHIHQVGADDAEAYVLFMLRSIQDTDRIVNADSLRVNAPPNINR
jgi:hypothetical protein